MSFFTNKLIGGAFRGLPQLINGFRSIQPLAFSLTNTAKFTTAPETTDYSILKERSDILKNVNNLIVSQTEGRLFAVVHLCGKQFKVTSGDIILVEGYWPPTIGDKIRLDKVLLVGGNDFTLVGRPILEAGLVDVQATIIEKTLTHTKTHFKKKRRKQYMRINFFRAPNTMIRINSIDVRKISENAETNSKEDELNMF